MLEREYPQRVMFEALESEREAAGDRTILGVACDANQHGGPDLGLTATVAAEALGETSARLQKRQLDWFYLISDGVGIT